MKKIFTRESLLASTIISGVVLSAMAATPVLAQSSEEEVTEVSSIVVTGTRIRRPGYESSSPISSVSAEEIALDQPMAVEELIKDLPAAVPSVGSATNNGSGGGATVNLRGLGTNRTLVLMNGRRVVPFNLAGVVDTNVIPVSMIERVDLVTGGASAVYGADAVAGVVNFVLKENFSGVELSSAYGFSQENDAVRRKVDLTVGGNFADDRGNAVVNFGYTKTDPLYQDARPWGKVARSSTTGLPLGSGTSIPSRFGVTPVAGGTPVPEASEINLATGFLIGVTDPSYNLAGYNYNPFNLYQTPLNRYQINGYANYKISPKAEVYAQVMHVNSEVLLDNAPTGTFGNTYSVPIGNPFIPDGMRQQLCAARNIAAAGCVSGAAGTTIVPLTINRRFVEMGSRPVSNINKTLQITAGIRGDINDDWNYDVYASHGETEMTVTRIGWGSLSKLRNALNTVSTTQCLAPGATAAVAGCVPINVFGGEGTVTQAMIDYINLSSINKTLIEQDVISGSISGVLPANWASPWAQDQIGLAVGLEWRRSSAATQADAPSQMNGEVLGTGAPVPDRQGEFEMREAFAELSIPILSDKPFAHSLNFEAGYRYSDFETAQSKVDYGSYKLGGDWAPVEDLRLRAMFQRATRAPNIGELYNPQVTGLSNLAVDPCQGNRINAAEANTAGTLSNLCRLTGVPGAAVGFVPNPNAGQINVLSGGNPALQPEIADTWTLGLVWQPSYVPSLRLSVDYYDIKMEDTVSSFSVNDVIEGCYNATRNSGLTFNDFCQLVGRSNTNGTLNGVEAQGISLLLSNLGKERVSGWDIAASYRIDLDDFGYDNAGRIDLSVSGNILTVSEGQATPASINRDCVGYYSTSCGEPRVKQRWASRATWSKDDYSVSLLWRHLGEVSVEPTATVWHAPYAKIGATNYFDLSGRWGITESVSLTGSISNLLNEAPPEVGSSIGTTAANNGNTFPQTYDAIGRFYTLGVTLKF